MNDTILFRTAREVPEPEATHAPQTLYRPLLELTRGDCVESVHFGAVAVVDAQGNLLAWAGDPYAVTYLRSTAKPFQALPFLERGGHKVFHLTGEEIALICASHSGTDAHLAVLRQIQEKVGVSQDDLQCGVHPPIYPPAAQALRDQGLEPTPNHHNCSGKHTGMLAHACLRDLPLENYLDPQHPVQQAILETFVQMANLKLEQVSVARDGCSAPIFAVPLYHSALAYARLCDPGEISAERAAACREIVSAMTAHPFMVGGPERFDTLLMQATQGRILAKGGAEGFQGIGVLPGVLGSGSPGLGIAVKIADGDRRGRAKPAVVLEVLRQIGAISAAELEELSSFGPVYPVRNWRDFVVGEARPCFTLHRAAEN